MQKTTKDKAEIQFVPPPPPAKRKTNGRLLYDYAPGPGLAAYIRAIEQCEEGGSGGLQVQQCPPGGGGGTAEAGVHWVPGGLISALCALVLPRPLEANALIIPISCCQKTRLEGGSRGV